VQILSAHAPEAVEKLLELMRSEDQQVALAAVREILNRVYGKAPVAVGVGVDDRTTLYQAIAPKEASSFEEWLESVKTYRH
jgi:DNA-binding phage protein